VAAGIRIYFEGDPRLKPGFGAFLREIEERARIKSWRFDLIATEGAPARDFGIAPRKHPGSWNILLLDSEGPDDGS